MPGIVDGRRRVTRACGAAHIPRARQFGAGPYCSAIVRRANIRPSAGPRAWRAGTPSGLVYAPRGAACSRRSFGLVSTEIWRASVAVAGVHTSRTIVFETLSS